MLNSPTCLRPCSFSVIAGCLLASVSNCFAASADSPPSVAELIQELGDDDYHAREAAQQQLLQIGPEAFEGLVEATHSSDLEIAARSDYILHRMRVQWQRPEDPLEVRQTLARYGELSDEDRLERIQRLEKLPHGKGLPALVRIARFDASPLVARLAALVLLDQQRELIQPKIELLEAECGASQRASIDWVRTYLLQLETPQEAIPHWLEAIDAELKQLDVDDQEETNQEIAYRVMRHCLELCNDLQLVDETTDMLVREIQFTRDNRPNPNSGGLTLGVGSAITWIIENQRWQVLDQIEQRYEKTIRKDRLLIYLLATAYAKQEKPVLAEKTARRATELIADDDEQRINIGKSLEALGQIDWAEREWRYVIDGFAELDLQSVVARSYLARWMHDREQYREAADLLAAASKAIEKNRGAKRELAREYERAHDEPLTAFMARQHFYEACYFGSIGEYAKECEQLKKASEIYERDPDILIAMYRAKGADEEFREQTMKRIRRVSGWQHDQIRSFTENESLDDSLYGQIFAAHLYNQWAWLIANTEGDYQRALEYSKKSLEMTPGDAGLIDTLARCYYAVGDYEKAVKFQREAVEMKPYYQIMRRQLEQFEKALENAPQDEPAVVE